MHITVMNTKGGVGKTTTSIFLALAAHNAEPDARVTVIDYDPQKSSTSWAKIAASNEDPLPFEVREGFAEMPSVALNDTNIVIADTPTSGELQLDRSVRDSDLVVIPTEADGLGLARTYATLDFVGNKGAVLLTRVRRRTRMYADAKAALEAAEVPMFEAEIPDAVRYRAYGTTPTSAGAYADVWQEIKEELNR